ncbi:hypothetical protein F8M41_007148 [Gigaspora margarita]|uniref:Uncharacterized protein n=1 Tax=Gigaspora margarita TaxID=4874 RepID=A0A8H4AWK8_GIGMA|nr:hypothetical protein F8M41_007148 [Gigaspora margarita]
MALSKFSTNFFTDRVRILFSVDEKKKMTLELELFKDKILIEENGKININHTFYNRDFSTPAESIFRNNFNELSPEERKIQYN